MADSGFQAKSLPRLSEGDRRFERRLDSPISALHRNGHCGRAMGDDAFPVSRDWEL